MILKDLLFLILSLLLVIKSADFAIRYSTRLAENLKLSKYVIGFLVVAVISILPETFISLVSAVEGIPAFGLGTLFGSNVADLTLVFTLVVLISGKNLKVESKIIKNAYLYIGAILIPLLLGLDGYYSRWEGLILIIVGLSFYFYTLKNTRQQKTGPTKLQLINIPLLLASMGLLLIGSHLTIKFGVNFANNLHVSPVLIGMLIVALGTTLPEMTFSIKAARKGQDSLALGDILGTVIADATLVVGLMTLIKPFAFNPQVVYITGLFMFFATVLLFHFIKTGKVLTKKEAWLLALFYFLFISTELIINN